MNQNRGLIITKPRPTDYILGGFTLIQGDVRQQNADWSEFITKNDPQSNPKMDTMACVSFSATHCIEMQINWLIKNNKIPASRISWLKGNGYINSDGKCELSERFLAKVSGTTKYGNTFQGVWDAARKIGMVPASDWLFAAEMSWEDFYSEPGKHLFEKASQFLDIFNIQYQWVSNVVPQMINALAKNPLQIAIPDPAYHAVTMYKDEIYGFGIYDQYIPFEYTVALDYKIQFGVQAQVSPITTQIIRRTLKGGSKGDDVKFLQTILNLVPDGIFGAKTRDAVIEFQVHHQLEPDGIVGPKTYGILNTMTINIVKSKVTDMANAIQVYEGWTPTSRSYKNNNPGNLRHWSTQVGTDGGFAVFKNYQEGYAALCSLIDGACNNSLPSYKHCVSIKDFFHIYSPSSDHNNPDTYAKYVADTLKVSIDFPLKSLL